MERSGVFRASQQVMLAEMPQLAIHSLGGVHDLLLIPDDDDVTRSSRPKIGQHYLLEERRIEGVR